MPHLSSKSINYITNTALVLLLHVWGGVNQNKPEVRLPVLHRLAGRHDLQTLHGVDGAFIGDILALVQVEHLINDVLIGRSIGVVVVASDSQSVLSPAASAEHSAQLLSEDLHHLAHSQHVLVPVEASLLHPHSDHHVVGQQQLLPLRALYLQSAVVRVEERLAQKHRASGHVVEEGVVHHGLRVEVRHDLLLHQVAGAHPPHHEEVRVQARLQVMHHRVDDLLGGMNVPLDAAVHRTSRDHAAGQIDVLHVVSELTHALSDVRVFRSLGRVGGYRLHQLLGDVEPSDRLSARVTQHLVRAVVHVQKNTIKGKPAKIVDYQIVFLSKLKIV